PIVPISHTSLLTPATKPNEITNEASVTDDFGRVEKEADIESIKSRLVGKFTSWEKGIILKLENGQKWKVVSASNGYKKMLNPMITISRGLFGSFNARVDGLNAGAKVKRVK
ncbi:MAG: hypothetical protein L3J46_05920, partial [Kangiellaceae bacterium]|nr:hypothetical protein [Kangiellaceae bacterium]